MDRAESQGIVISHRLCYHQIWWIILAERAGIVTEHYTFLTALNGTRSGSSFLLDAAAESLVGRGTDCHIVLSDPLCSRVHARIEQTDDGWWLHDAHSRNGTYVNQQKIDDARLVDGCIIRFGSAEFSFHEHSPMPADVAHPNPNLVKTAVFDQTIDLGELTGTPAAQPSALLQEIQDSHDFLVLYQLSIRLLGCSDPDEVTQISLDVLSGITGATAVGFLWMSDDGQMKLKLATPDKAADAIVTNETLTGIVCGQGQAVWMNHPTSKLKPPCLTKFADAICVPLLHEQTTPGAIHLVLEQGAFKRNHFQFAKSLANIVVAALVKTRQQATLEAEHQRLIVKSADFADLIGESEPVQRLKERSKRVARATGCLLIRGESGVGKELVARAVHRLGARADRPLLSVNCAAIPRDLMESQLFGHKKGSFTGADADHIGWFEQADSGTLFLDEVGEMTLEGQAKLLRILDGHPFLPVGGTKERTVDVRVIAATNRDLREFVREKKFREDLYYRLTVFELYIPPLRERGGDIDLLANYFLDRFRKEHGRPQLIMSDTARHKLLSYGWPGNVRQLRNVIDSAVVMAEGDVIQPEDLGLQDAGDGSFDSLRVDVWEQRLIHEALKRTSNSVPDAAKLLGLGRATVYRKIEEYGIER